MGLALRSGRQRLPGPLLADCAFTADRLPLQGGQGPFHPAGYREQIDSAFQANCLNSFDVPNVPGPSRLRIGTVGCSG
jgi:hypothetical protein